MDLTNILEGIISGVAATLISTIIILIINKIVGQQKNKDKYSENTSKTSSILLLPFKYPFLTSLFITSFMAVLTFSSMVYSWEIFNYVYLFIATFVLGVITYLIYDNQCPNCNRIFSKKLIKKDILRDEKRPYQYRDETIYLYSDGTEKDRRYSGREKTRMETWRTEKEFYECTKCFHKWDKISERNLDIDNRPKPSIITTKTKPPDILDY